MSLKLAYEKIQEIRKTTGSNAKKIKLKEGLITIPHLRKVFLYALDFNKSYSVSGERLWKKDYLSKEQTVENIFACLDKFAQAKGVSNDAIEKLSFIASMDAETIKCVKLIVNKDLDCGLGAKSVKKEIPELPEHGTMLCGLRMTNHLFDHVDKFVNSNGGWSNICWSLKKNGVRANIFVTGNKVKWLSRSGKEYNNFHKFDKDLIMMANSYKKSFDSIETVEFDGEVTPKDKSFNNLMTQTRRLEGCDDSIFQLELFDLPTHRTGLQKRLAYLEVCINKIKGKDILYVEHHLGVTCQQDALDLLDKVSDDGEEGLVLKGINSPIKHGKNHKHWMKVKRFNEADCKVLRAVRGEKKYASVMGALEIDFNGYRDKNGEGVKVGGGYTDKERELWLDNPPALIEVHYKEETEDGSMLFPTFYRVREDK